MPHDGRAGLGHQHHREFQAGCAFIQGSSRKLSLPVVLPGCADMLYLLSILNADSKWFVRQILKLRVGYIMYQYIYICNL